MNIFYLHKDPIVAAQMSCDKHVVKMILESAQLLSTCHRVQDGTEWYDKTANGRRIKRAEEACKRATTDWSKNFWFTTMKKLCEKYGEMDYFRKQIH